MSNNLQAILTASGWDVDGPMQVPVVAQLDTNARPTGTLTTPDGQVVGGGGLASLPSLSVADPAEAFQAGVDSLEASGLGAAALGVSESDLVAEFDEGIEITPSKLSVYGAGHQLDFSAMTSGYAMTLNGYVGDINIASSYHQPHEIMGLHVIGPGTPGVGALVTEGTTTQVHKYQITFRNMTWRNFDETFRLNRDTWGINWFSCHFRPTIDCSAVLNMAGTRPDGQPMTNAGERMSLFGCTALNGGTFLLQTWGNTDTQLINCSVDQFDCVANVLTGKAMFIGGHYENLKDNDHWFKATGSNAVISVRAIDMYLPLGATYSNYSPFYSDEACRFGGIDVDGLHTSIGATYNRQTLCHGYGRAVAKRVTFLDSSPRPPFSRHMNEIPDGTDVKHWDGWTPMPGVAVQQTGSDSIAFGLAPRAGAIVPATFAGRALTAADVGAIIYANSSGSTGACRIVGVHSATAATVEVITTFNSAGPTVSYYAFFPSDANVPARANGWSQPFTGGVGVEPNPGDTVTGGTSGATIVVTSVKKTSGTWGVDAAGVVYGFAKTGSFSAAEAFQVGGVTFASVAAGGAATTNYAMSFVGTGTTAQRVEKYLPWKAGDLFTMAYVADLANCAAVTKALSVTVAYCDENKQVIGSTQGAVSGSSANGFKSGGSARANVTPAPAGTKFARVRFEASAASGTGGVITVGDVIINAL